MNLSSVNTRTRAVIRQVIPSGVVRGKENPRHRAFSQRLRRLRRAQGRTLADVAEMAGLAGPSVVSYLETGQRAPQVDTVERIAYALGLSPATLAFGHADECQPVEKLRAVGIGARLRLTRETRGFSVRVLAEAAALSHTAVGNIEKGGTMPTIATLEALAKKLRISPAWLAYGTEPREIASRRRSQPSTTS
jgi:transcriptional regulator with XRE-family HTH domain